MDEIKKDPDQEIVVGINSVTEIIKQRPHSVKCLIIDSKKSSQRIKDVIAKAVKLKIRVSKLEESYFTNNFSSLNHQGVAILCNKRSQEGENFLDEILKKEKIFLLILDHMTDPHNVGACIRSAAAARVDAVISPKDRSCHLTPTVRKISSGGAELIPFIVVTNLVRTIKKIRSYGVKVLGASQDGETNLTDIDMKGNICIVIGSEDKGLKKMTSKNCDSLLSIHMPGNIESLNASVSTGIILFEYIRQNKHAH